MLNNFIKIIHKSSPAGKNSYKFSNARPQNHTLNETKNQMFENILNKVKNEQGTKIELFNFWKRNCYDQFHKLQMNKQSKINDSKTILSLQQLNESMIDAFNDMDIEIVQRILRFQEKISPQLGFTRGTASKLIQYYLSVCDNESISTDFKYELCDLIDALIPNIQLEYSQNEINSLMELHKEMFKSEYRAQRDRRLLINQFYGSEMIQEYSRDLIDPEILQKYVEKSYSYQKNCFNIGKYLNMEFEILEYIAIEQLQSFLNSGETNKYTTDALNYLALSTKELKLSEQELNKLKDMFSPNFKDLELVNNVMPNLILRISLLNKTVQALQNIKNNGENEQQTLIALQQSVPSYIESLDDLRNFNFDDRQDLSASLCGASKLVGDYPNLNNVLQKLIGHAAKRSFKNIQSELHIIDLYYLFIMMDVMKSDNYKYQKSLLEELSTRPSRTQNMLYMTIISSRFGSFPTRLGYELFLKKHSERLVLTRPGMFLDYLNAVSSSWSKLASERKRGLYDYIDHLITKAHMKLSIKEKVQALIFVKAIFCPSKYELLIPEISKNLEEIPAKDFGLVVNMILNIGFDGMDINKLAKDCIQQLEENDEITNSIKNILAVAQGFLWHCESLENDKIWEVLFQSLDQIITPEFYTNTPQKLKLKAILDGLKVLDQGTLLRLKKICKNIDFASIQTTPYSQNDVFDTTVSSDEIRISKLLAEMKIPHQRQVQVGQFNVDFVINDDIFLEYYGSFHQNTRTTLDYSTIYKSKMLSLQHKKFEFIDAQSWRNLPNFRSKVTFLIETINKFYAEDQQIKLNEPIKLICEQNYTESAVSPSDSSDGNPGEVIKEDLGDFSSEHESISFDVDSENYNDETKFKACNH